MHKHCPRCEQTLPVEAFAWKSERLGKRASECRDCHKKIRRAYYEAHRSIEIENARRARAIRRPLIKAAVKEFKSRLACNRCGQTHPATLQFHHIEPSEKEGTISQMIREGRSFASIIKEAEKCEVLCANCHLIEHYAQYYMAA